MEPQKSRTFRIFLALSKESRKDTYTTARAKEIDPAHWGGWEETLAQL